MPQRCSPADPLRGIDLWVLGSEQRRGLVLWGLVMWEEWEVGVVGAIVGACVVGAGNAERVGGWHAWGSGWG